MSGMRDMILATAVLVERSGATGFSIEYHGEPDDPAEDVTWSATCFMQGARIFKDGRHTPEEACLALGIRLLRGAACKCTRPVTLDDPADGCKWTLNGDRWSSSCQDEPVTVRGERGDMAAQHEAMTARMISNLDKEIASVTGVDNRAARRAAKKNRRRR